MKTQNTNMIDWDLLAAYISENATNEQVREVENWLAQSDANKETLAKARKVWDKIGSSAHYNINTDAAWNKVNGKAQIVKQPKTINLFAQHYSTILKVAAVALIVIVVGTLFFKPGKDVMKIAQTSLTEKTHVTLPDGSEVDLNFNSKLEYPNTFKGNTREVILVGEAFFSIKKNKAKPFIIHTGDSKVKVLGTSFNVNNRNNNKIEVIVNTGIVAFYSTEKVTKEPVLLTKGEKVVYSKSDASVVKSQNTDLNYLSWKTGKFIFRETALNNVFDKLEDFYGIQIKVENEAVYNCRLTATFDNKPADEIMNVLKLTFGIGVKQTSNQYYITGNGCFAGAEK